MKRGRMGMSSDWDDRSQVRQGKSTTEVVLAELSKIRDFNAKIFAAIEVLKARDDEHKRNVEQFYSKDWQPLKATVEEQSHRIAVLERVNIAHLEERLAKQEKRGEERDRRLEKFERWRAWLLGAAVGAGGIAGAIADHLSRATGP